MLNLFENAAALCYGSLMCTTNMSQSGKAGSFEALRDLKPSRAPQGQVLRKSRV